MVSRWLNIRESAVSLLRIFALLVVLFLLTRAVIDISMVVDSNTEWYATVWVTLDSLIRIAYYGSIVFALSWIVSLIGKQTEGSVRSGWLNNRESAVSLLRILALLIVLFCLLTIGVGILSLLDEDYPWYDLAGFELANTILRYIIQAAYYGGTVLALSWIVSLICNWNEENIRGGWLNDKESVISLLRIFALVIVILTISQAVLQGFISKDWNPSWKYTVDNIVLILYLAFYQGGIIFALSWIVSLLGRQEADEVPDEIIT